MGQLPRENFLAPQYQSAAYEDNPVPIGLGQTISQPYIVALMTQCLGLAGTEQVLEIGTGSGYQTAILAKLCKKVCTIERFDELSARAQSVLSSLAIHNVEYAVGDGSCGWQSPLLFNRIIVTAAVPRPPEPLVLQLQEDGILVAPVGDEYSQTLIQYQKQGQELKHNEICGCRFVKLIGKYGFPASE
jgi:protein-L-isoaspartate(D-aspartate) O-methyltransferase